MSFLNSSLIIRSFIYDVSRDGGTIGTYNMGTFLPGRTVYPSYVVSTLQTLTSVNPVATVISVGMTGIATDNVIKAQPIGFFATVGQFVANIYQTPIIVPVSGSELTVTIGGADLLSGKLVLSLFCIEFKN